MYNIRQGYKKGFLKQAAFYINTVIALVLAPIAMPVFITGLNAFGITHELEKMIQGYIDMYTYSHSMAGVRLAEINASNAALISQDEITKYIVAQKWGHHCTKYRKDPVLCDGIFSDPVPYEFFDGFNKDNYGIPGDP